MEKMGEISEKNCDRMAKFAELNLKPFIKEIVVEGRDNLENLNNKPVIFTPTHLSNLDVTIAIKALADEKIDFKIVQASTHNSFIQNPGGFIANRILGKNNFFSIETYKRDGKEQGIFQTEDFFPMAEYLKTGGKIIMVAYYSDDERFLSNVDQKGVTLSNKGGVGAIYLAQKTDAIIIPIAVDINENKKATVHIGKVLDLNKIEDIERLGRNYVPEKEETITEERERRYEVIQRVKKQSDLLMNSLAEMLPIEKRGRWQ